MHFDEEQLYRLEKFNNKGAATVYSHNVPPFCNVNCYLLFELYQ